MADSDVPVGFGARAQSVRDGLASGISDPASLALIDEAARIADRLDNLDSIIAGRGVLELMRFRVGDIFDRDDEVRIRVDVKFDSVLAEARQQASVFRQILTTLGVGKVEAAADTSKGTVLDELERRRAARVANTNRS